MNPTTGKTTVTISVGSAADVDRAVTAAQKAFDTTWGLKCPGYERGKLLMKLADLLDENREVLAAVEALDNGKTFSWAYNVDVPGASGCIRYYAGWADKNTGKVMEVSHRSHVFTLPLSPQC